MDQKNIVTKILYGANKINSENRVGIANYITLKHEYIKQLSIKNNISFNEMIERIKEMLK